jgi:hypothetical protein
MSTARPPDAHEGSWPTSFEILRFVGGALAVDAPKPIPALKKGSKQLQRFYRGRLDEIDPKTAGRILRGLVDRYLVQDPVVIRVMPIEGRRDAALADIARALAEHLDAWNNFAAWSEARYRGAPESVRRRALLGQLRLVALDIGVYVGYFIVQAGLGPEVLDAPTWNIRPAEDRTLRTLLLRRNMRRDALVAALNMRNPTTVDRWCDGGRRPSDENLTGIARALEHNPVKRDELRQALRRHFALRQFVSDLAGAVGWDEVQDLLAAVLRFAKGAQAYMTSTWVEPMWRPLVCKMVLDRWMLSAPSPHIVNYLLVREEASRWRGVLRGLQFASFHAQFCDVELSDGRVERVTQYPRVVAMTLFDARLSDTSTPERSEVATSSR